MSGMSIRAVFPARLKHYMAKNEKSRNDLVHDLDLKYSTIRDWEKGITVPRMDKVEALAVYFGCSPSDLLEYKETSSEADANSLSSNKRELLNLVRNCPEEDADRLLQIMKLFLDNEKRGH